MHRRRLLHSALLACAVLGAAAPGAFAAATISSPPDNARLVRAAPVVRGTADPGSTVEVTFSQAGHADVVETASANGGPGNNEWVVNLSGGDAFDDGTATISALQTSGGDPADTHTVTIDQAGPVTGLGPPTPADNAFVGSPSVAFGLLATIPDSAVAWPGATFECAINSLVFGPCSNPVNLGADGVYTVSWQARDVLGDVGASPVTASRTFTVDTTAPDTQFTVAPPAQTTSSVVAFTPGGTDTNAAAGFTFACRLTAEGGTPGAFDACPATFGPLAPGVYTLEAVATDAAGNTDASPAQATFEVLFDALIGASPAEPQTGETITLTATTNAPASAIAWDLDGDGEFDDATGPSAQTSFPLPGLRTVLVQAQSQEGGATDVTELVLAIRNRLPVVGFAPAPSAPREGDRVTLTSSTVDPEGRLSLLEWDLDDDGRYDDATGPTTARTFTRPGRFRIALRAGDLDGGLATLVQTITVRSLPVLRARVRIAGRALRGSTRVTLLEVRAPGGSRITVRCSGGGCPRRSSSVRVRGTRTRTVRIRAFGGRTLRPGATLRVSVNRTAFLGKYTRFTMRRGAAPRRIDRCLRPASSRPSTCPSA